MLSRSRLGLVALTLVPVLGTFSIQGAFEVAHPLEETSSVEHTHAFAGPTLCDALDVDSDIHGSHYCLHLNVFAPIRHSEIPFDASVVRSTDGQVDPAPLVLYSPSVPGRGPPSHG